MYKMCTVVRPNLLADCWLSVIRPQKIGTNHPLQRVVVDDIGYNKYNKHDSANVIDACALFDQFCNRVLVNKFNSRRLTGYELLSPANSERIRELILATQFPHKYTDDLACQALQDTDLTQNWNRQVEKIVMQLNEEDYPNPSLDFPSNELLNLPIAKTINTAIKADNIDTCEFSSIASYCSHYLNIYFSYGLAD